MNLGFLEMKQIQCIGLWWNITKLIAHLERRMTNMKTYASPIEIIREGIEYEIDNNIVKATQKIGFNIDAKRLAEALKWDKSQYYKGQLEGLKLAKVILEDNGCKFGPLDDAIVKYKSTYPMGGMSAPDTIIKIYNGQVECKCPNGHNIPMNVRDSRMPYCPFCGIKLNYREKRYSSWEEFKKNGQ